MAGLDQHGTTAGTSPVDLLPAGDVLHAMAERDLVGQAKGVVRCLTGCTEEAAFQLLVKVSKASDCTLPDVAQLVADGAGPGNRLPSWIAVPFARGVQLLRAGGSLDGLQLPPGAGPA